MGKLRSPIRQEEVEIVVKYGGGGHGKNTSQRGDGGLLNQTQGFHQARYDLHARTSQVRLHILFLYLLNK